MNDDPAGADDARRVWLMISDLVLDNQRRRAVSDALGISFGKSRALRRIAREPQSMTELAAALEMDPPNMSVLINDLESRGLVKRGPHPEDRRAKLLDVTAEGRRLATLADTILGTPPRGIADLCPEDLADLRRVFEAIGEKSESNR